MGLSKSVPVYFGEEATLPVKISLSFVFLSQSGWFAYRLIGDIMYLWNQFDEKITHESTTESKKVSKGSSGERCSLRREVGVYISSRFVSLFYCLPACSTLTLGLELCGRGGSEE